MNNDVLIFAEQRAGRLHSVAPQLIAPARALADGTGGSVVAVVIGADTARAAKAINLEGVDRVIRIDDASLAQYTATRYRTALCAAIDAVTPRVVLLGATFMGRDLAPRVAARSGASLATDVIALTLTDGALDVERPVYNGKAFCHVRFPADRCAIASVRANTFPAATTPGSAAEEPLAFTPRDGDDRMNCQEITQTSGEVKDVTEADIIVSGGRSLKSEANFDELIYPLAKALDAAVGASRAACDAGYQPHSKQVGLTGKTVTPKLYIACGISGAIQHLAGMRGSKCIVAINTDAEAPMCKIADYVINDDLFKVLPALREEVSKLSIEA